MTRHFPDHITGTARALSLAGYSSAQIARELVKLYPDDPEPTDRTIRQWRQDSPEISNEESEAIAQRNREIALVAQKLTLERLEQRPDELNPVQLMTVAGIAQSKEHERLQRNAIGIGSSGPRNLVIILNADRPIVIPEPVTIDAELEP